MGLLVVLLLAASAASMVESKCGNKSPKNGDFKELCQEWWERGINEIKNSETKICMNLIKENCPHMIDITKTLFNIYYEVRDFPDETWTYKVQANRGTEQSVMFYNEFEIHPICGYDDGDVLVCDHWWKVAKDTKVESKKREQCIERILKRCASMITLVGEVPAECFKKCPQGYQMKTFIYKNQYDERASYDKLVPVRN